MTLIIFTGQEVHSPGPEAQEDSRHSQSSDPSRSQPQDTQRNKVTSNDNIAGNVRAYV